MNKRRNIHMKIMVVTIILGIFACTDPASAANGSVVYTYDALGRVASASYDTGIIIIYAYDANGNRTSQTINANAAAGVWGTPTSSPVGFIWGAALWHS